MWKMKVGILTYHHVFSQGAHLQAFALQEILKSMRHEVSIIDYRGNAYSPMSVIDVFKSLNPYVLASHYNRYVGLKKFGEFESNFNHTRTYIDGEALKENSPQLDAIVVGSDQVWQLRTFKDGSRYDKTYFLDFATDGIRKIAYAPSFGHALNEERIAEVLPLIKKFDFLSVREDCAAKRLSELINRTVENVCDPTLLFGREGFGKNIPTERISNGCVFVFEVMWNYERELFIINRLREKFGKVEIESRPLRAIRSGFNVIDSPFDWVRRIRDAQFVLTDSFHGTVFSILYHKPFIFLPWSNAAQNLRVKSLLSRCGLLEFVFKDSESVDDQVNRAQAYDNWTSVDREICAWRESSRLFLEKALS